MPSTNGTRNKKLVVVLGGLAGSGKSTASKELAKIFKLRHVSAGDMFRAIAKERGTDLIALGRYAAAHPAFDKTLDRRMVAEAKKGMVVLDGRATAYLTKKSGISAVRIFLTVDPKISAKRVSKRDGISVAEALQKSRLRERELKRRLTILYGLDAYSLSTYDAVIQTDDYSVEEVVALIVQLVNYGRH